MEGRKRSGGGEVKEEQEGWEDHARRRRKWEWEDGYLVDDAVAVPLPHAGLHLRRHDQHTTAGLHQGQCQPTVLVRERTRDGYTYITSRRKGGGGGGWED